MPSLPSKKRAHTRYCRIHVLPSPFSIITSAAVYTDPHARTQQDSDCARAQCLKALGIASCSMLAVCPVVINSHPGLDEEVNRHRPVVAGLRPDIEPQAPARSQSPSGSSPPGELLHLGVRRSSEPRLYGVAIRDRTRMRLMCKA